MLNALLWGKANQCSAADRGNNIILSSEYSFPFQDQLYKFAIGSSCSCVSFISLFIHFFLCHFSYYIMCGIV